MLTTTDKMPFLRCLSLFRSMTLEQFRVLASHLEAPHCLEEEVIFSEQDLGHGTRNNTSE